MFNKLKIWVASKLITRSKPLNKIVEALKGKKTYITAAVIGIAAALNHLGIEVPDVVFQILAALGLMTLRAGVSK